MSVFKHRLRLRRGTVTCASGRQDDLRSLHPLIYYVAKVTLALFMAMVRKYAVPKEEAADS